MAIEPHYEADNFALDITVEEDGAPKDITGATVVALFGRAGTVVAGTTEITDAENGVIRVTLAEDALTAAPDWHLQVRVTVGGETQTVFAELFNVRASLRVA